jgi:hypothetical protein
MNTDTDLTAYAADIAPLIDLLFIAPLPAGSLSLSFGICEPMSTPKLGEMPDWIPRGSWHSPLYVTVKAQWTLNRLADRCRIRMRSPAALSVFARVAGFRS